MKVLYLFIGMLFFGCQNASENNANRAAIKVEFNKEFKKEHHLFLNYYFGMSISDYENATKRNFTSKEILLSGEKEECELNQYNHKHTITDIDNINAHSIVYYEFTLGSEEFEATLKPVFRNDKLIRIELQTLNCYNFGNHNHEFYRRKINNTRAALLKMLSEKYGDYTIKPKIHSENEKDVIKNEGVAIDSFDTNTYTFVHNNKRISVTQKCCDFKPIVIYTLDQFPTKI